MSAADFFQYCYLFCEQVGLVCLKNFSQKQRNGRQFWKDTVCIQFFTLSFVAYILYANTWTTDTPHPYSLTILPPLSSAKPWGIFNQNSNGNNDDTTISKRLYYSPNDHLGVQALIDALVAKYPSIEPVGAADMNGVNDLYESNLFDTWASLQFTLTTDQITTQKLVTSQTNPSVVSYTILNNPSTYGNSPLSTDNTTDKVYNDAQAAADLFWSSGYFTLQNFVATYLAQQYNNTVPSDYTIDTFIQRFPSSPVYADSVDTSIDATRSSIWKWIGGTILAICLFVPMLTVLTEMVRERQFFMKDLLEISGLMNSAYYFAYLLTIFVIGQIAMWFCIGLYAAFEIFDGHRISPYASLLSIFIVAAAAFGMTFGFVIPRSEYYGLPVFLLTCALTVCGAYLGIADNIDASVKLFFCFLSPSLGLTMGVLIIETYLHSNSGAMDYHYTNDGRAYPSLNSVMGVMIASAIVYYLIAVGMPFDWLYPKMSASEMYANAKADEVKYPCDNESEETGSTDSDPAVLKVSTMSHIYPDGTHAVKEITFDVKDGEVLSFLGSNGAGKSTCMKMLCGTLDPTTGDATVNGYSITNQRVLARRNLGIAMQQDIIWDDINVEDHLMLFGRLRGLHGLALRTAVTEMAESLGFPDKRKSLAGTLSGGQKRRLCVGLSMVGGNRVVYLDEPTAGLDPVSRRQLWELVQKNRAGRAILLTTHFMDEADVLGDRIAVVKEGRLRALGTARFLKQRFGIGYLLRMSLKEGVDVTPIVNIVQQHIPNANLSSNAGTELAIRMPREAVQLFPEMLEYLENNSPTLGVLSFGIETTTLEEVFMRIVNEDNEQLLTNHAEANRMLSATAEERESNRKALEKRDDARTPLPTDLISSLLIKGMNANGRSTLEGLPSQTFVMLYKRFYQFVRSRGQWSMGVGVPLLLAILIGVLLSTMPTDLLGDNNDYVYASYSNFERTVVGGPNQAATEAYMAQVFPDATTDYVGNSYVDVYNTVDAVATTSTGIPSVDGIYVEGLTNFTVMYNASYPVNFAGAVQNMVNAAVRNVTNNLLILDQTYSALPDNRLDYQLNNGFFIAMLVALIGGSFGAGMSIILSGERVSLVKHQQLASGASSVAYWVANFIFDLTLIFSYIVVLAIVIAIFCPDTYTGDGFGYVVGSGFFFAIASVFRFYSFSYFIADVRLAQSIYFYGTLAVVFVLIDIWFTLLFTTANGNINDGAVQAVAMVFTVLDPTFGWYTIILYQNNFLGILTQNDGDSFWSPNIAGGLLEMLIVSAGLYGVIFIFFTENALGGISCFSGYKAPTNQSVKPMQIEGEKAEMNQIFQIHADKDVGYEKKKKPTLNKDGRVSLTEKAASVDDPDVIAEREKVHAIADSCVLNAKDNAIFICNLRKIYYARGSVPSKVAVQNINLAIPKGEIFGLLGANGAGKTTLLKMVSGLEQPTSGFALINGHDVVRNTSQAQRSMGLCPQFDTLIERLTVRENLLFFGKIKGLSADQVIPVTEAFLVAMNIKRYESKLVQQLSGGNRRKVSLAVALMGAPPTVYLDEPSTGLDPVASRLMWRLLSKISAAKNTAIVLTTHNMLECEAVCTRVCIMKLGQMVCLGDSQHLRSTHGTGFQLEVSLKVAGTSAVVKQFVVHHFAGAVLLEEHSTMLNYEIPRESITKLSKAFKLMQDNKDGLGIEDYVLSQSTLEQVFLKQIRVNESDMSKLADQSAMDKRVPLFKDYFNAYCVWLLAGVIPGLHHFYLGNHWRGVKYLFTLNEVAAGWLLDLFDLHVLVQKSVQEHGHTGGIGTCCFCCGCTCCSCCKSVPDDAEIQLDTSTNV
jgi:ATP-binding cassette subfamily A (ABC1) protein 3